CFDHDAARTGFVGAAADAADPTVVAIVGLAGVRVVRGVAAAQVDVRELQAAASAIGGFGEAVGADVAWVARRGLYRCAADGAGLGAHATASMAASASGRRSLPEIRRGSMASRNSTSARACFSFATNRSNRASATATNASISGCCGSRAGIGRNAFLLISMNVEPFARPLMPSMLALHQK